MNKMNGVRAACYMRMSTAQQRYSIQHQTRAMRAYAAAHGYKIVRIYQDAGKSGVRLAGRTGLSDLLGDVVGGAADFDVVLVLDISRWGRFQDPDEAAHYEFICRSAGVRVEYCAEDFPEGNSIVTGILKQLKRGMAAEYSRELSHKVATVQRELAGDGWRMAGAPGYGLRRQVVDPHGRLGPVLERGFRNAKGGGRIILTPGPEDEVATVRRIFKLYLITGMTALGIAHLLNGEGVAAEHGARWTANRVRGVLHNEKYMGVNVHGRKRKNLQARPTPVAPSEWVVVDGAWEPLVSREQFEAAASVRGVRRVNGMSDQGMLDKLRELLDQHGFLNGALIDGAPGVPCVTAYVKRFGRLSAAYTRVGYQVRSYGDAKAREMSDTDLLERLKALLDDRGRLSPAIINGAAGVPHTKIYGERFGTLEEAFRRVGYVSDQEHLRRGELGEGVILTADGRYMVVRGRLFRAPNPYLCPEERDRFVVLLAEGRKLAAESRRQKKRGDEQASKRMIRKARQGLGELGPPWWTDGAMDYNRCLVANSPYADDVGLVRRDGRGKRRGMTRLGWGKA